MESKNNLAVKVTLIAGLPGSGKSHLLTKMESYDSRLRVMDDISINRDFLPSIDRYLQYEVKVLSTRHLVLSDPLLVSSVYRQSLIKALVSRGMEIDEIDLILFDNDPEQCLINSMNRPGKPVAGLILQLTKEYDSSSLVIEVDDGDVVLVNLIKQPVWKPEDIN